MVYRTSCNYEKGRVADTTIYISTKRSPRELPSSSNSNLNLNTDWRFDRLLTAHSRWLLSYQKTRYLSNNRHRQHGAHVSMRLVAERRSISRGSTDGSPSVVLEQLFLYYIFCVIAVRSDFKIPRRAPVEFHPIPLIASRCPDS